MESSFGLLGSNFRKNESRFPEKGAVRQVYIQHAAYITGNRMDLCNSR